MNRSCLLALALSSFAFTHRVEGQQPGPASETTPGVPPLTEPLGKPGVPPGWAEDPERLERKWRSCMSPQQYRAALKSTGMADHLGLATEARRRAREQGITTSSGTGWVTRGPVGGFGDPVRNGRVAGIQVVSTGIGEYTVYVGSCQGGLWRTSSAAFGQWESLGDLLPSPSVRGFAVHPGDPDQIVVGTGDYKRYDGSGMYRTTDAGVSWNEVPTTGATGTAIHPESFFRVLHLDSLVLVAASSEGLLRSTDGGASFARTMLSGGGEASGHWTDLVRDPSDPLKLYGCRFVAGAQTGRGVFQSTDGGQTWTQLTDPVLPSGTDWGRASLALCRDEPANLAVLVENDNALRGVFRSTNSGATWQDVTGTLAGFGSSQVFHAQAIAIRPDDPDEILVGAVTLARSTNGGATWSLGESEHSISVGHADITQLHFTPVNTNDVLWICNDGGIYWYYYTDGETRDVLGDASSGLICSEIDFMDGDRLMRVIGTQDNGVAFSEDGGLGWSLEKGGDGADVEITDPVAKDYWFTNGVFNSAPSWRIWRRYYSSAAKFTDNPAKYMPRLFYDRFEDTMYTHADEDLYASPASGTPDWQPVASGFQADDYSTRSIWGNETDGRSVYVVYWGDNKRDLTVLRESGGTWTPTHFEDFNPSDNYIETVAASHEWPGELWVGFAGDVGQPKLMHTTDHGATWEDLTANLADVNSVRCIVETPFDPLTLYVGTDLGMFRTTDGGSSWQPYQEGLPIGRCRELRFIVDDGQSAQHSLYLAIDGHGSWQRTVATRPIVYVDKAASGAGDGSFEHPFSTVAAGVSAAPSDAIVAVRTNEYLEPQIVTKGVQIVTWGGSTLVH